MAKVGHLCSNPKCWSLGDLKILVEVWTSAWSFNLNPLTSRSNRINCGDSLSVVGQSLNGLKTAALDSLAGCTVTFSEPHPAALSVYRQQ